MAIEQPVTPVTFNLLPEVASRVILLNRDVIDNKNGSVSVNFSSSIYPKSITYEVDEQKNKIGIYETQDLDLITISNEQLMQLFGIRVILADGTISYIGEVLANFADQIINKSVVTSGTINTQSIDIERVLVAQSKPIVTTISGNVGIGGAIITYGTETVKANINGDYSFTVDPGWNGTVTPSLEDYSFNPANKNYSGVSEQLINQNYVASIATYTISGNVEINGVKLDYESGSTVSDAEGNYSFSKVIHESGTITPSLEGYTFEPVNIAFTDITTDKINQNFIPTVIPPKVTVTITGNVGTQNVSINYDGGTTTSDNSGNYSITVDLGWSGTITPSLEGHAFTPANLVFTSITGNQENQNFTVV